MQDVQMSITDTPATITPEILTLCRSLAATSVPEYVVVKPSPSARQMECYPNVERQIASSGGSIIYGWQIWEWSEVYLEAEFHAVWKTPAGELVDLTPKDQPTPRILFLEDPARKYENRMVPNVVFPLSEKPEVLELVAACNVTGSFLEENLLDGNQMALTTHIRYQALQHKKQQAMEKVRRLQKSMPGSPEPKEKQRNTSRNHRCYCGSGKKYKKCHGLQLGV